MNHTKTLRTIQILSKIGKILSKIVFVCCIVGAAFCAAGIVTLALIPDGTKIGDTTIKSLIEVEAETSRGAIYGAMAAAVILLVGEIVLARLADRYFTRELADGTPFTLGGAKQMQKLGICAIVIPIAAAVAGAVTDSVVRTAMDGGKTLLNDRDGLSVGLGIMFLVTSLICRHGAELTQQEPEVHL